MTRVMSYLKPLAVVTVLAGLLSACHYHDHGYRGGGYYGSHGGGGYYGGYRGHRGYWR